MLKQKISERNWEKPCLSFLTSSSLERDGAHKHKQRPSAIGAQKSLHLTIRSVCVGPVGFCIWLHVSTVLGYKFLLLLILCMYCAESTLLVCRKDIAPLPQKSIPDGNPITAPVPKSQGNPIFPIYFIFIYDHFFLMFLNAFCIMFHSLYI